MLNRTNHASTCKNIKIHTVDLSIVLESPNFLKSDEEHIVFCLSELISTSFKRFKEKVIVIIEDAILYKKLDLKKLRTEELEREKQYLKKAEEAKRIKLKEFEEAERIKLKEFERQEKEKTSSIYILEKSLCNGIDELFKNAIANVDVYLEKSDQKDNKVEKTHIYW